MAKKAAKRSRKTTSRKTQTTRKKAATKAAAPAEAPQPTVKAEAQAEPQPVAQATAGNAPAVDVEPTTTVSHDQIAELAYQLWEAHGQPEGWDQDHWIEAERQLRQGAA